MHNQPHTTSSAARPSLPRANFPAGSAPAGPLFGRHGDRMQTMPIGLILIVMAALWGAAIHAIFF